MLRKVFSYLILTNQIQIAEPKIYHHLVFLQELGGILGGCMTVKNGMAVTHTEDDQTTLFVLNYYFKTFKFWVPKINTAMFSGTFVCLTKCL